MVRGDMTPSTPSEASWVTERLERAGWAVTHVINPAIVVEGRELGVARVLARRATLHGVLVVARLGQMEEASHYDRPSAAAATRTITVPPRELRAEVFDLGRAHDELVALRECAFAFEAAASSLARQGWDVDTTRSGERSYDDSGWQIVAASADATLHLGVTWSSSHGSPWGFREEPYGMRYCDASLSASARYAARSLAHDLLAAL